MRSGAGRARQEEARRAQPARRSSHLVRRDPGRWTGVLRNAAGAQCAAFWRVLRTSLTSTSAFRGRLVSVGKDRLGAVACHRAAIHAACDRYISMAPCPGVTKGNTAHVVVLGLRGLLARPQSVRRSAISHAIRASQARSCPARDSRRSRVRGWCCGSRRLSDNPSRLWFAA